MLSYLGAELGAMDGAALLLGLGDGAEDGARLGISLGIPEQTFLHTVSPEVALLQESSARVYQLTAREARRAGGRDGGRRKTDTWKIRWR